jgi:hypothetical protein
MSVGPLRALGPGEEREKSWTYTLDEGRLSGSSVSDCEVPRGVAGAVG